jgi:hypothetical protein
MRLRIGTRLTIGAAVSVLAIAGAVGTAQAATSSAGDATVSVRSTSDQTVARAVTPAAACNTFNRTQLCYQERIVDVLLENRTPVGTATFVVTHSIHLNAKSRDFSEQISISNVVLVGMAGGIHVALADKCGSPCTPVGNNFPVGRTLASGLHGTLTFHDSIAKGRSHSTRSTYTWVFVKAGFPSASATSLTARIYRCDFAIGSTAGCVFTAFTPVMTSMLQLPHIRANIHRIQSGGGHYGRQGSGHPLRHTTNKALQIKNNAFLCPRSLRRPPGMQCDEYPFASTREGGSALPANSRGRAFVPAGEQRRQGGLINSFYSGNRVLDGDPFWVQA